MYFPESNCPFYRVTYLSNYSPYMTPDNKTHYSLLTETSYSDFKHVDGKTIVDDTVRGLINAGVLKEEDQKDIVDTWVYHADYSYPTPTVERDGLLSQVIPYLERHDIYSRGRFGMWKYEVANTDHTLMQGVELVNRLLNGEPETTIGIKYESTLDGRNAASHERSHHAGSGDPKKEAERAALLGKAESKTSPERTVAARNPGQTDRREAGAVASAAAAAPSRGKVSVDTSNSLRAGGPGDKEEVHVSEEELGVTTPLKQQEDAR
jgi:hypothetical protein